MVRSARQWAGFFMVVRRCQAVISYSYDEWRMTTGC